jgi:predicted nucleic acid-binding protein
MKRVFADTGYWIALLNPHDELHARALALAQSCSDDQIVTTEMVLTELLNGFSDRGPRLRAAASKAVNALRSSPKVTVVPQTSEQFQWALTRYEGRLDKDWSLTDCASFVTMEAEGIGAALTHDQHFAQAGFQALLR